MQRNIELKTTEINKKMVGEYEGHWSGYSIWFLFKGEKRYLSTVDGVRGIDVHCVIKVSEDGVFSASM